MGVRCLKEEALGPLDRVGVGDERGGGGGGEAAPQERPPGPGPKPTARQRGERDRGAEPLAAATRVSDP